MSERRHHVFLASLLCAALSSPLARAEEQRIDVRTAVPNRFGEFLAAHRSIRCVAFNGRTAAALYRRQVLDSLPAAAQQLHYIVLPSTSPAHATLNLPAKLRRWAALRTALEGMRT